MQLQILFRHVYFQEFCECVAQELQRRGVAVRLGESYISADDDVALFVGIHLFPDVCQPGQAILAGVQTEQLGSASATTPRLLRNRRRFQTLRGYFDLLFDWIPGLAEQDGRIFVPYGCHPSTLTCTPKQFDVCFIGNIHHSRRERLLKSLQQDFQFFPDFSPGFGPARLAAIQQSRILLNLRFYEDGGFESPRMFDYLSAGAFVISERTTASHPFVAGRDFIEFEGEEHLRELLRRYLADESARLQVAASGHQVSQQNTWETVATQLLSAFQTHQPRAAWQRWCGWLGSRFKCTTFSARDQVSLIRRRVVGG